MARSRNGKVTIRRTPDGPGDLVSPTEAAEILEVERTRVARYAREGKMPIPVAVISGGRRLWLRSEVEEIAEQRRARKERRAREKEHEAAKA